MKIEIKYFTTFNELKIKRNSFQILQNFDFEREQLYHSLCNRPDLFAQLKLIIVLIHLTLSVIRI